MSEEGGRRGRVVFVSPMCLLDSHSGAARSVRTMLEMLAAEGFECRSVTASLFDGAEEYPRERVFGAEAKAENAGKILKISRNRVDHHVFHTPSSLGGQFGRDHQEAFLAYTVEHLKAWRPDIAVSYGSSSYSARLIGAVRPLSKRFVFYLGNPDIKRAELFAPGDVVLCPTQAQVERYRSSLGLEGHVFRTPIGAENAADPSRTLAVTAPSRRRLGFVTFVNPALEKGALLAFSLARRAARERPDLTFLFVESRAGQGYWHRDGRSAPDLPNLWWLPNQADLRRVYERTAVLLFPSFWFEVAGRCIAEAQLGGIPVLASGHGGIPEQLNGGGFAFDIPEACKADYRTVPDAAAIAPWFDTLTRLMDDDAAYGEAVARAREAARIYDRGARQKEVAALFDILARQA